MTLSLKNKIVLITGASSGIGEACARLFAAHGAKLILTARRADRLTQLSKELSALTRLHTITLDVQDAHAVADNLKNLPHEWQAIDILINNAGLARGLETLAEANIQHWEEMIDTNIKGLLYVSRAIMPGMLIRNNGHIINIGSISGRAVYAGGAVYCATKHAVRAISEAMKIECHGTPIRITEIAPGAVETEFSLVRYDGNQEQAGKMYAGMIPLTADDIADSVLYAATRPAHVDIREIVITPVDQTSATLTHRRIN